MKTALCLILFLSPRCSLQFARFKGVGLDRHLGGPLFDHFLFTHFVSMLSCACLLILFSLLLCFFVNFYKLHTPFGRLEVPLPIKKNERTPFTTICLFHFFLFLVLFIASPFLHWLEKWHQFPLTWSQNRISHPQLAFWFSVKCTAAKVKRANLFHYFT